jgi:hypothetical protein
LAQDGIGYSFSYSEITGGPLPRFEMETTRRDRKKFDDDDELCFCADPCDEVNQACGNFLIFGHATSRQKNKKRLRS